MQLCLKSPAVFGISDPKYQKQYDNSFIGSRFIFWKIMFKCPYVAPLIKGIYIKLGEDQFIKRFFSRTQVANYKKVAPSQKNEKFIFND